MKSKEGSLAAKSFELIDRHKELFLPNLIMFASNFLLLVLFLELSGIGREIFSLSSIQGLQEIVNASTIWYFLAYVVLVILIDNYFTCAKYGMIKDLLSKGKTSFHEGLRFGKTHFFTTLKVHSIVFGLIVLPVILLVLAALFFAPENTELALLLFSILIVTYLVYMGIRLLFIYPVMAFEDKGAYISLRDDFHYVKSHMQHTYMTWLFVVSVAVSFSLLKKMAKEEINSLAPEAWGIALFFILLVLIFEMFVSLWEHVFIFSSYLEGKGKKKAGKKAVRKSSGARSKKSKTSKKKSTRRKSKHYY